MSTLRLILLGPPAAGKGTQGRQMDERWHIPVVSAGDLLRREIAAGTPLGREAAEFMNNGRLVPDRVALDAVRNWIEAQAAGSFVFDGFPRTVGQAEMLEEILARHGTPLTAVIWLELGAAAIAERVSRRLTCSACGRSFQLGWQVQDRAQACPVCGGHLIVRTDDEPAALQERMEQYQAHTAPVKDFYAARGLLRPIDAGQTADEVFAQIELATGVAEEAAA